MMNTTAINMGAFEFQKPACGFYDNEAGNLLVTAPTSTGKTSKVAVHWLRQAGRGWFIVQFRDLCEEVYDMLCEEFGRENVAIADGNHALDAELLKEFKYVVMTPFKMEHYLNSVKDISKWAPVVVLDEVHQFNFKFDTIYTRLLMQAPRTRVLALSGTVSKEDRPRMLAWMNATLIESDVRPVELTRYAMLIKPLVGANKGKTRLTIITGDTEEERIVDTIEGHSTVTHAIYQHRYLREIDPEGMNAYFSPRQRTANDVLKALYEQEKKSRKPDSELQAIADSIPSRKGKANELLKKALPYGLGLLHSNLSPNEKRIVRRLFRQKKLNGMVVCLSGISGLNLPVRNFVFCGLRDPKNGRFLDVTHYMQGGGRAGRAGFDVIGRVLVPIRTKMELVEYKRALLAHEASPVVSKLDSEIGVPSMIAGLIKLGRNTERTIVRFLKRTYWGMNFAQRDEVKAVVQRGIECLRTFKSSQHEPNLLNPDEKDKLCLTHDGHAMARLALQPKEFRLMINLTDGYDGIEEPGETDTQLDAADNFRTWVETIGELYGESEGLEPAECQKAIEDVTKLGLAVSGAHEVSYHALSMADYLRRFLDRASAYLRLYHLPPESIRWWRENIYRRSIYGELEMAHAFAACPGISHDMIRRLINEGLISQKSEGFTEEELVEIADTLYGHRKAIPAEESRRAVSKILGTTFENWSGIVEAVQQQMEVA